VTLLLDTNVFLWCIAGLKSKLSRRALNAIADERNELLLSAVSLWEIFLKVQAGKLDLSLDPEFFRDHMTQLGVRRVLAVEARHVYGVGELPDHHRDPFDRLLVAQAIAEGIPMVASDAAIRRYPVEIFW
jgi:PIN domain nuclease of toxin-antitoxin system